MTTFYFLAVTSELTSALQFNIMGQTRNLQSVLDHCSTIYPSLFVSQDIPHQKEFKFSDELPYTNNDVEENVQYSKVPEVKGEGQPNYESAQIIESLKLDDPPEQKGQPITPVTERDIKYILEIVLTEAVRYLNQGSDNAKVTECCGIGKACATCRDEIFDIVESILTKVMESPRFNASSSCSNTLSSSRVCPEVTQYRVEIPNGPPENVRENLTSRSWENEDEKSFSSSLETRNKSFDYQLIKDNLLKGNDEERSSILRDLRRGLTKSNRKEASKILEEYIRVDIFNIKEKYLLLEELLRADSALLNEQVFCLLNTMASFRQGRNYLSSNNRVLTTILVPKFKQKRNPVAADMLVGCLQKLSLQKHMRIQMVKEGLLGYLVGFLDESYQKMSLYSLEYSIALLMNLCLEDDARAYCENNTNKVIYLLKKLLKNPNTSYIPYINGVLLSLLPNEKVNEEARKQSLDKVIRQLARGIDDEYLQRQLEYIIEVRFSQQLRSFIGDDDEFPEKDDILETELDSDKEREVFDERRYTKSEIEDKESYQSSRVENLEAAGFNKKSRKSSLLAAASKKKRTLRKAQNFPITSYCYLEICQGIHDGSKVCRCPMCTPGKTRYSCGCYDLICQEIAEEIDNIYKEQNIKIAKNVKKVFGEENDVEGPQQNFPNNQCAICGDKVCDCAFESRPKIHRTPPKT